MKGSEEVEDHAIELACDRVVTANVNYFVRDIVALVSKMDETAKTSPRSFYGCIWADSMRKLLRATLLFGVPRYGGF